MLQTVRGPDAVGWVPLLFGKGGTGVQKPGSVFRQNSGIRWWGWSGRSTSQAKGDSIDNAVPFRVGETAASRGFPDTGFRGFGLMYMSRQECLLHLFKLLIEVSLERIDHSIHRRTMACRAVEEACVKVGRTFLSALLIVLLLGINSSTNLPTRRKSSLHSSPPPLYHRASTFSAGFPCGVNPRSRRRACRPPNWMLPSGNHFQMWVPANQGRFQKVWNIAS